MDGQQFDDALRAVAERLNRRTMSLALAASGALPAMNWLGSQQGEAASKKCKKKKKKKRLANGQIVYEATCKKAKKKTTTTTTHAPHCPSGQVECGGSCVAACPLPSTINPLTCTCCFSAGLPCPATPEDTPCCFTGEPTCGGGVCQGAAPGAACQFTAQCRPPLLCLGGTCSLRTS